MRKVTRLTESDLIRLVKKVIRENGRVNEYFYYDDIGDSPVEPSTPNKGNPKWKMAASPGNKVRGNRVVDRENWYDERDKPMNPSDLDTATHGKVFGPDQYEEFMEYINDCDTMWCVKTKNMFDKYQEEMGPVSVVKRKY